MTRCGIGERSTVIAFARKFFNDPRTSVADLLRRPPEGYITSYDASLDAWRSSVIKGLTPKRIESVLSNADNGEIADALELFEEIVQRDARTRSVAGTRRRALTGLPYRIVSAADVQDDVRDKTLAEEAAAFVRESLDRVGGFKTSLIHMATAIGPNLAVLEQIWTSGRLVDIEPVPIWRLAIEPSKSFDIRVRTKEHPSTGIPATSPKFVVHVPEPSCRSPLSSSLLHAQATLYLIKRLALADWAAFVEQFGIPMRIGKYQNNASSEEKKSLLAALKNLGSSFYGAMSQNAAIEIIESSTRGIAPHEAIINHCGKETSILWLGGNLTSDTTGGTGTFAAADVQDDIREDIRDADIESESTTVRDQIIAPMVRFRFNRTDVPLPVFQRIKPETVDRIKLAQLLSLATREGLKVPRDWAYEQLGIPMPQLNDDGTTEAVLEPIDAFADGLTEGLGGSA